ncbi:universal stress protein [Streptomyces sp. TRM66268-LWL]|uniref:Universal stress protein n=1 Tax=Streptomyces polyasparticus TaxID=2767826 RepID=A0ABR7SN40_9ACTN|nr:universal stress protein [Streptomyces polyasparticus]MBC9715916.1 universal stress protein [Streptomyces polyasparticus]
MEKAVVVGYDGSARSEAAARLAVHQSAWRGCALYVVHVISTHESPAVDAAALVAQLHVVRPDLPMKAIELTGPPVHALLGFAAAASPALSSVSFPSPAELLVLGVRGAGGFAGQRIGSVAEAVAARATVPVALVPGGTAGRRGRGTLYPVALGVDAHRPVDAALGFAFDTARRHHCGLRTIYACRRAEPATAWEYEEVQALARTLEPWRHKYPTVKVLEDMVTAPADEALSRLSGCSDLLVVGRRGVRLGAVARALIEQAEGPVVVVPE